MAMDPAVFDRAPEREQKERLAEPLPHQKNQSGL